MGFVPDSHGGGSDLIAVFHVWQSSLRSRVTASRLETLLVASNKGGLGVWSNEA